MSTPFLGEVRLFPMSWAPRGWHVCDGSLLSISTYSALFALLGTQYGGNGTTTFALPDLRGRTPIHFGNSYVIGETDGTETVALTTSQMPIHNHSLMGAGTNGNKTDAIGNAFAGIADTAGPKYGTVGALQPLQVMSLSMVGSGIPHENLQPFLVFNYSIALVGVFPTRN